MPNATIQANITQNTIVARIGKSGPKGDKGDAGTGLAAVVEDTTPQLGGNLDLNGNQVGDATAAHLTFLSTLQSNGGTRVGQTELGTTDTVEIDVSDNSLEYLATRSTDPVISLIGRQAGVGGTIILKATGFGLGSPSYPEGWKDVFDGTQQAFSENYDEAIINWHGTSDNDVSIFIDQNVTSS